ncbi:MAG TPA: MFS transporter [Bryobacteraceae bacterium]|nr:MFS transporter [Bryobacteraceae bacterium]
MQSGDKRKWLVVGLLFCAAALNYGDRSAITAVFPLLHRDLGMSDVALAAVSSFFLWSYALVSPVAGYLGDRFSRTTLITSSLFGWSLATAITSMAASTTQLLSMRVVLGVVEAAYMPAAVALIADCHAKTTRATAMAIHTAGYSAGMVAGGALAGFLGERYGWRWPLLVLGVAGILLAMGSRRFFRTSALNAALPAATTAEPPLGAVRHVLRIPTCRLVLVQAMLAGTAMWILLTWMPLYFLETFRMSLAQAGFTGTFYAQAGMITGTLAGGQPSDWVARRKPEYRMLLHAVLYLAAAPLLLVFLWSRDLGMVAAASVGFFLLRSLGICNEHPVLADLLPARLRATTIGLSNSLNCVAGGAGVLLAGLAKPAFGLGAIFATVSILYVVCSALLFLGYGKYFSRDILREESACFVSSR